MQSYCCRFVFSSWLFVNGVLMSNNFSENFLREQICLIGKSLFDRGLTHGSTGNISAVTENGDLLITPTGCSLGRLQPDQVCKITSQNEVVGTMKPTKELFCIKPFMKIILIKLELWFICIQLIQLLIQCYQI